jgi:hypothetical protein
VALQFAPGMADLAAKRLQGQGADVEARDSRVLLAGAPANGPARIRLLERTLNTLAQ